MDSKEIQVVNQGQVALTVDQRTTLTAQDIVNSVELIKQVCASVMREGVHFGVIPGCGKKPSLFKAGAEVLGMTFRLAAKYDVVIKELENGHREYSVTTSLENMVSKQLFGQGIGSCTTMESKYRYRTKWEGKNKIKLENENIADTYNTVLKIAKKRSFVDAILNATSASDMFTQDIEDIKENEEVTTPAYVAPWDQSTTNEDPGEYVTSKGKKIKEMSEKFLREMVAKAKSEGKSNKFTINAEAWLASLSKPKKNVVHEQFADDDIPNNLGGTPEQRNDDFIAAYADKNGA